MKALKFFKEVYSELHRISWPSSRDLLLSSLLIFITVAITSVVFSSIDYLAYQLINFLLNFGV